MLASKKCATLSQIIWARFGRILSGKNNKCLLKLIICATAHLHFSCCFSHCVSQITGSSMELLLLFLELDPLSWSPQTHLVSGGSESPDETEDAPLRSPGVAPPLSANQIILKSASHKATTLPPNLYNWSKEIIVIAIKEHRRNVVFSSGPLPCSQSISGGRFRRLKAPALTDTRGGSSGALAAPPSPRRHSSSAPTLKELTHRVHVNCKTRRQRQICGLTLTSSFDVSVTAFSH